MNRLLLAAVCALGLPTWAVASGDQASVRPFKVGVALGEPSGIVAVWRPRSSRLMIGGDLSASLSRLVSHRSTYLHGLSRGGAGAIIGGMWMQSVSGGGSLGVTLAGGARAWFLDYGTADPVFDVALRIPFGVGGITRRGMEIFLESGPAISLTGLGPWVEASLSLRFPL